MVIMEGRGRAHCFRLSSKGGEKMAEIALVGDGIGRGGLVYKANNLHLHLKLWVTDWVVCRQCHFRILYRNLASDCPQAPVFEIK